MKPTIKIYIGRPVSGAEANAVKRLHSDLSGRGVSGLLLVNFTAKSRQIDCVAVTTSQATLLDFKEITGPVRGGVNGRWFIRSHGGSEVPYPGENPYMEVVGAKNAVSDEMDRFQKKHRDVPPPTRARFYKQFDAAVCICPDVAAGSTLSPGDFKCWIWGYPVAVEKICTRSLESSWTMDHWERFAHYLSLESVTLESATDQDFRKSEQALSAYGERLVGILGYGLPPELPHLAESLPQDEHFLLLGPSGIGKTIRLQRHSVGSVNQPALVLFAEAMHYTGEFRGLLQKAVAPFFGSKIEELRHSASVCGAPTTLVVDGFDRCRESLRPNLLRDISAFHELSNCRVVIGSKFDPDLPPSIKGQVVQMPHLTSDQKLAVFRFHAGDSDFSDSSLLEPFETAHDLMVAGKCRSNLASGATRTEVYDAYVAQCLPASHRTVAGALCRHLAAVLSKDFGSAISCHDFEKEADSFVSKSGATLQVVDDVRQTYLVNVSLADFSFRHELIQEHFYADWLCRAFEDFEALVSELQKPAHRHLAQAVLSRQKSPEKARAVLQAVPDADLFAQVFQGRCGATAKQVLFQDCHTLLSDAAADVANVAVDLKLHTESGKKLMLNWPELTNCRPWTAYETSVARFIGRCVDAPEFTERVADLLAVSGASLHVAAEKTAQGLRVSRLAVFDSVLHVLLMLQGPAMKCPISEIFHAWRHSLFGSVAKSRADGPWPKALLSRSSTDSVGCLAFVLFALCEARRYAETPPLEDLERVFRLAWNTKLRSLRLQALEMLEWSARHVLSAPPKDAGRIRDLLSAVSESTSGSDLGLNTTIIETLNAYEMIPPPVDEATALQQMRGVLDPSSDYAKTIITLHESFGPEGSGNPLAEEACRIVSLFFEDVFQGVHNGAFETMAEGEQLAFMNLAAQAREPFGCLAFVLRGLVRVSSPSSAAIFERYATRILFDTWMMEQDAVQAFLLAVIGCAKLDQELPPWQMAGDSSALAWGIIREIVYHHVKPSSPAAAVDELWLNLRAEVSLGAADALFLMKRASAFTGSRDELPLNFEERYPEHIKAIMEHSLLNLDRLTSVARFGQSDHHMQERAGYIISVLGRIGDGKTVEILKRVVSDGTFGKGAIASIKAIKGRLDFQ